MTQRLGIVAGSGKLPFFVAQNAKTSGIDEIYAVAFQGQTDPELEKYVDEIKWIGLGQLGKLIGFFHEKNVNKAVFIGKIDHKVVFSNLKLDFKMIGLAAKIKDWRTDSILRVIVDEITESGITIIDSTVYLKNLIPNPGVLTKTKPGAEQYEDIIFGYHIARKLGELDIGQTVVVKKKTVLALEAIEGTDEAILRGGKLGKKGAVVVKLSKPKQDLRFDVPVVGLKTMETMNEASCSALAIEAYKTLVADLEEIVSFSDKNKISIVVFDPAEFSTNKNAGD